MMKNKNILLVNGGETQFSIDFIKRAEQVGLASVSIDAKDSIFTIVNNDVSLYCKNVKINHQDINYFFTRLKGKSPHMTTMISRYLSFYGLPFNDLVTLSSTLEDPDNNLFNGKITQMLTFALNGLSIPNTIIFSAESYKSNSKIISTLTNFPCVVKTTGAKGASVWKVQTQAELEKIISENYYELMILQELLEIKYDVRALIFNSKYLGAIKRTSTDGFYTNISKGGRAEKMDLTDDEILLSIKACKISGVDFGGVDFVRTPDGIKFFEVNKSPQVKGFQSATNINVPYKIVDNIKIYLDSK